MSWTRSTTAGLLLALSVLLGAPAHAQNYPSKPITLIVPWPPGGSSDMALRAFGEALQKQLGQSIVVENRPGAAGTLGPAQMAATAKPDGYTISQSPMSIFRMPYQTKTTFDPTKDFTYIAGLTGYTFGVVVSAKSPWKTLHELLDYAKANPDKVTYGCVGTGTSLHIGMEELAKRSGVKWRMVPFKGGAETNAALLGGHVDAVIDSTSWKALVDSGDFRLLATWGTKRTKNWPNVPTLTELGIPLVMTSPYGIVGPKGIDPKIVAVLDEAIAKAVKDPMYLDVLDKYDQELGHLSSSEYQKFAVEQIEEGKRIAAELKAAAAAK